MNNYYQLPDHSIMSPTSTHNGMGVSFGESTPATVVANHHLRYNSNANDNQYSSNSNNNGGNQREEYSSTSESLCNFANSTPYRLDIGTAFSSLEKDISGSGGSGYEGGEGAHRGNNGGAVIGSPLSAFSVVESGSNSGGKKQSMGGESVAESSIGVFGSSSSIGREGKKGRETSLLVSPRFATSSSQETLSTSPNYTDVQQASSTISTTSNNDNAISNNHYPTNPNPSARDPTPYHYRGNPMTSPLANTNSITTTSNFSVKSAGSDGSRSGLDPPAKSPFPSHVPGVGGSGVGGGQHHFKGTPNSSKVGGSGLHYHHGHHNEENELSMIEEDASLMEGTNNNNNTNMMNQSQSSTVTGLTLLRTPIFRKRDATNTQNNNDGTSIASNFAHTPLCSTEKLLRRPSHAMRDSFQQLATQTAHKLESIWDLVGVSPDERAVQLSDLVEKIASICDDKINEEQGLADQFSKEIELLREEWESSCRALQLGEVDPVASLKRDPSATAMGEGVSLQCEYEAILGRLENIRSVKAAAMEDLEDSKRRIYEAYAALHGCSMDEAARSGELEVWSDIETDLTEQQREVFRSKACEYEESVSSRTKAVVSLMLECQSLIRELEIVPPSCVDGGVDGDYCAHGPGGVDEVGRSEDDVKIMKGLKLVEGVEEEELQPLQHQHRRSRKSASDYTIVSLCESPTCTGIGNGALERLTSRLAELNGEKRRRRERLGKMGRDIAALWTMLRIPQEEQQAFTESIRGLGLDTIRKGGQELNRLHDLKAVMIGKLIREQRQTIEELWEKTNSSDVERASFDSYFYINDDAKLTDDLLSKHEEYVASLNAKLAKMQPILDLIAKREAIISERFELEILQKDPDRLKGRGATKQLMKEEKMGRRVQKELPKITHMLEKTLTEWYHDNRPVSTEDGEEIDPELGHFMYQNTPYLETMYNQEHEWKTRKERGEQERQRKRQEERSATSSNAFGTSYSKLPGRKWNPSMGSTTSAVSSSSHVVSAAVKKPQFGAERPRSASNARAMSNSREGGRGGRAPPRPLADVSSLRQNVPRASSRSRNGQEKPSGVSAAGNNRDAGYRATSAPRPRF